MDPVARTRPPGGVVETGGRGWVTFAGTMLLVAGAVNVIGGIGAVDDSAFFAGAANYLVGDLETLGWIVLVAGVIQVAAGVGIWAGSFPAVWIGAATAGLNAIAQLLLLPAQPLWSLGIFTVDVLVLRALIVHADI